MKPTNASLNSLHALCALLIIHTIGPQAVLVLPALVQGYLESIALTEREAGLLSSVEMGGMFVAAALLFFLIDRIKWRTLLFVGLLLMAVTNLASMAASTLSPLYIFRFVAGFGAGVIVMVTYAMIGKTLNSDRNFGLAIFFVVLYAAVVFPLVPWALSNYGMPAIFLFFSVFGLFGFPALYWLPDKSAIDVDDLCEDPATLPEEPSVVLKAMMPAALLTFFIGFMAVWIYLFRLGVRYDLGEQSISNALAVSQVFAMAGAFSVVVLTSILRREWALGGGLLCSIAVFASFFSPSQGIVFFTLMVGLYQFFWNMLHPYLLAALASLDTTGRLIVLGTAMQFLGTAIGPGLAALVLKGESYGNVLWLGIGMLLLSLALAVVPTMAGRQYQSRLKEAAARPKI